MQDCLPFLSILDTHPSITSALNSAKLHGQTSGVEVRKTAEGTGVAILLRVVPAALVDVVADHLDVDWTSRGRRNG